MPSVSKTEQNGRKEVLDAIKGGKTSEVILKVKPLKRKVFRCIIEGTSPYVQENFGPDAVEAIRNNQLKGSLGDAKKGKKRSPKDFEKCYQDMFYRPIGAKWYAIPACAIRAAMIDVCRMAGVVMTMAKRGIWVEADGMSEEKKPLIRITKGEPSRFEQAVWLANGNPDIRIRPMWDPGWQAEVRIKFDASYFTGDDIMNLLMQAGEVEGIGAGRNTSSGCAGLGWGCFAIVPGSIKIYE